MYGYFVGPFNASIFLSLALLFGVAAQFRAMDGYSFLRGVLSVMEPKLGAVYAVALLTLAVSPFILNDVLVLVLTPTLIQYSRQHRIDPAPLIVAEVTLTNVASALTPIGNPQNILLWGSSGAGFIPFVLGTWPGVLASAALALAALFPLARRSKVAVGPHGTIGSFLPAVYLALVAAAVVAGDLLGLPAFVGLGAGVLLGALFTRGGTRRVRKEFDLRSLLLLCAFVAATDVVALSLSGALLPYLAPAARGAEPYSGAFVALASNLVSNVPATQLLIRTAGVSAVVAPKIAVEAGLAGNLGPAASFANILALRIAMKSGVPVKRTLMLQLLVGAVAFLPALL